MPNHLIFNYPAMQKEFIPYQHFIIGFPNGTRPTKRMTSEVEQFIKGFKEEGFYIGLLIPEANQFTKPVGYFNDDELEFSALEDGFYIAQITGLIYSSNVYNIESLSLTQGKHIEVKEMVEVLL